MLQMPQFKRTHTAAEGAAVAAVAAVAVAVAVAAASSQPRLQRWWRPWGQACSCRQQEEQRQQHPPRICSRKARRRAQKSFTRPRGLCSYRRSIVPCRSLLTGACLADAGPLRVLLASLAVARTRVLPPLLPALLQVLLRSLLPVRPPGRSVGPRPDWVAWCFGTCSEVTSRCSALLLPRGTSWHWSKLGLVYMARQFALWFYDHGQCHSHVRQESGTLHFPSLWTAGFVDQSCGQVGIPSRVSERIACLSFPEGQLGRRV